MRPIEAAVLGCGGFAREVMWALSEAHVHEDGRRIAVKGFIDREPNPDGLHGFPVWSLDQADRELHLICGIGGMPEIKQRVVREAAAQGFRFLPGAVHDSVRIGPNVTLGAGTIVCAGHIITVALTIGTHVAVNLDGTISHDTVIDHWCTLSPGVHVSGRVTLGEAVYAGTGASIIEGITVRPYAVIGAGAVVTNEVPESSLVVGVPAKVKKLQREFMAPIRPRKAA